MIQNSAGNRYNYYYKYNSKQEKYDYEHKGLLNHLMSHSITNTDNTFLNTVLKSVEDSLIFIMKYIERMRCFKKYTKYNR